MLRVRLEDDNSIVTVRHAPGLIELPRTAKGFMPRTGVVEAYSMSRITEAVLVVCGQPRPFSSVGLRSATNRFLHLAPARRRRTEVPQAERIRCRVQAQAWTRANVLAG